MQTASRKVSLDRTINYNNKLYEVPYKYVGQTIEIRYNVDDNDELYIYENNIKKEKCVLLNKIDNSKVKRRNNIDYEKLVNKEDDVKEYEE